jgi:hypothetical protein
VIIKQHPTIATTKRAYTVTEFCENYRVSRRELFNLWDRQAGPRFKRVGKRKIIILVDDAEEWARSDDAESPQSVG